MFIYGGWGEIRTHERLAPLPVFKTGALDHSATHPVGILRDLKTTFRIVKRSPGIASPRIIPFHAFPTPAFHERRH